MSEPIPLQSFLQGSGSNLTDTVRRAVEDGEYETVSEVIREALQLWEARRQPRQRELDVLRQKWDEGKASGRAGPLDVGRHIAEERAKD